MVSNTNSLMTVLRTLLIFMLHQMLGINTDYSYDIKFYLDNLTSSTFNESLYHKNTQHRSQSIWCTLKTNVLKTKANKYNLLLNEMYTQRALPFPFFTGFFRSTFTVLKSHEETKRNSSVRLCCLLKSNMGSNVHC